MTFNNIANITGDGIFLKFTTLDEDRIQIVLWDYRQPNPLQFGMIMNMQGEDFDAHSLEWAIVSLHVAMANFIMQLAAKN